MRYKSFSFGSVSSTKTQNFHSDFNFFPILLLRAAIITVLYAKLEFPHFMGNWVLSIIEIEKLTTFLTYCYIGFVGWDIRSLYREGRNQQQSRHTNLYGLLQLVSIGIAVYCFSIENYRFLDSF